MKNKPLIFVIFIVLLLVLMTFIFFINNKKGIDESGVEKFENNQSEIISRNGLHWHTELVIYVKNKKIEIPANVGLTTVHNPIHTHTEDASSGVIHLEFPGLVRINDTKISEFFKVWNKDINSFGSNIKMTVNGIESTEFGDYLMKDGDKVELIYN